MALKLMPGLTTPCSFQVQPTLAPLKTSKVANFPDLEGVWCVMDGLKIPIQKPANEETQNAYYNGWLNDHFIGCVFAFVPYSAFSLKSCPFLLKSGKKKHRETALERRIRHQATFLC
jgi:hypothetical protein